MSTRYAIYFTASGALAAQGAAWLGWDIAQGRPQEHPAIPEVDLAKITKRPHTYGFHGTIKAPFHLAQGRDVDTLITAAQDLCAAQVPFQLEGLEVARLGRFLALVPQGSTTELNAMAAEVVERLDPFRAPATADELARRRRANLSAAQEANLLRWGYPHVMGQFRFHMTLSGPLPREDIAQIEANARAYFAPALPRPLQVDALALVAERRDKRWQTVCALPFQG